LQDELVKECTELSKDSFGNPNVQEEFVRHCVLNASIVLFGRDYEGRLFGYSSNSVKFVEEYYIIYLQSMVISEKFQGKGLRHLFYSIKIPEEIDKANKLGINLSHLLLAGRTQNPLVFKFISRHLGLFPQPNGEIESSIRNIGKKFVHSLYESYHVERNKQDLFDDRYFVERGAYKAITQTGAHGVYPLGIPYCRDDDEINQYMNQHLDWQNGDAIIMLGYYNEGIVKPMFEDVQQRMGFCGIDEIDLEKDVAISYV